MPAGLDRGQPGASAAREYQRRKSRRESRTRKAHPRIGGLLLWMRGAPQHESAFRLGERGEQAVAASLARRTANGPAIILYDRRMPGARGNIDLLAIAPTGVYVIDAKAIKGKVRISRPLFGREKLVIEGRNRTKALDGLDRQVSAVRGALASTGQHDMPVLGVLCFTKADLPLFGSRKIRGHQLLYCRRLAKKLNGDGAMTPAAVDTLARTLAVALPPA
jgi:Nuclease-related domain